MILLADLHINEKIPYSTNINRMESELLPLIDQVVEYGLTNNEHFIAIAGDIFENVKISPYEFEIFDGIINKLNKFQIFIISGNHEIDNREISILKTLSKKYNFVCTSGKYHHVRLENENYIFMDYCNSNEQFLNLINESKNSIQKGHKSVLIAHQPVFGVKLENKLSLHGIPYEWFFDNTIYFDICFFGDFHTHQKLPNNKGYYIGALMPKDFSNASVIPGFCTYKNGKFKRINFDFPIFQIIEVNSISELEEHKLENKYIKVKMKLDKNINIKNLEIELKEKYNPKHLTIQPIIEKVESSLDNEMTVEKNKDEIINYVVNNTNYDNAILKRSLIKKIGFKYLQRKI